MKPVRGKDTTKRTQERRSGLAKWIEAFNLHGVFGRADRNDKPLVELTAAQEFANSMSLEFNTPIVDVRRGDDPPDIYARIGSAILSVELVELVDQKVREKRVKFGRGYPGEFAEAQWSAPRFIESISRILDDKEARYLRADHVFDALVIHCDEDWLRPRDVEQWLLDSAITPRSTLRSAHLLLFHDPTYRTSHWPVFKLYGDIT